MTRVVGLIVLIGLLLLGRWLLAADTRTAIETPIATDQVVVIGTEYFSALSDTDRELLDTGSVSAAVLRMPTGHDQCAAAGWAGIGAGTIVETGPICRPEVTPDGAVHDWHRLQESAGGQLGRLAAPPGTCVAAVGPSAALAAVRPDGTVPVYRSFDDFAAGGRQLPCPLTMIAAPGPAEAEALIADLAPRDDVTLIVVGLGPDHDGTAPQLIYRTQSVPGFMVGADDRQAGTLGLTDLSAALRRFLADPAGAAADAPGAPFRVVEGPVTATTVQWLPIEARRLADRDELYPIGLAVLLVAAPILALVYRWVRRGGPHPTGTIAATVASSWPAALMSTGVTGWWRLDQPLGAVGAAVTLILLFTGLTMLVGHLLRWPTWLAGATVTAGAGLVHLGLGAPWRAGSLLDRFSPAGAGPGAAALTVTVVAVLVVLSRMVGPFRRLLDGPDGADARWTGNRWVALGLAALGAAVVLLRTWEAADATDRVVVLLGLAAWTVLDLWHAPERPDAETDIRAGRVFALVAVIVVAVPSADPVWAWTAGSVAFAGVAVGRLLSAGRAAA